MLKLRAGGIWTQSLCCWFWREKAQGGRTVRDSSKTKRKPQFPSPGSPENCGVWLIPCDPGKMETTKIPLHLKLVPCLFPGADLSLFTPLPVSASMSAQLPLSGFSSIFSLRTITPLMSTEYLERGGSENLLFRISFLKPAVGKKGPWRVWWFLYAQPRVGYD